MPTISGQFLAVRNSHSAVVPHNKPNPTFLQERFPSPKAQRKRAMALGDSHPAPKPAEAHVGFIKVIFHRSDQLDNKAHGCGKQGDAACGPNSGQHTCNVGYSRVTAHHPLCLVEEEHKGQMAEAVAGVFEKPGKGERRHPRRGEHIACLSLQLRLIVETDRQHLQCPFTDRPAKGFGSTEGFELLPAMVAVGIEEEEEEPGSLQTVETLQCAVGRTEGKVGCLGTYCIAGDFAQTGGNGRGVESLGA